ncbi:MAG: hypothetical protein QXR45_16775 [Candidatus Bathyarchaeia archaeon]
MSKIIFIFDGPPASGKTTLSKRLAQKLHCPYLRYKALGYANIISTVILQLIPRYSIIRIKSIQTKEDPVLLLDSCLLRKMRLIIFLTEIPYKISQAIMLLFLSFIYRFLVIDEFFTLRIANYINVYLHGGLSDWQVKLLIRIDLALLRVLAKHKSILYIYTNRHIEELKKLWHKREYNKKYSEEYLTIVRFIWKMYQETIGDFAQILQIAG